MNSFPTVFEGKKDLSFLLLSSSTKTTLLSATKNAFSQLAQFFNALTSTVLQYKVLIGIGIIGGISLVAILSYYYIYKKIIADPKNPNKKLSSLNDPQEQKTRYDKERVPFESLPQISERQKTLLDSIIQNINDYTTVITKWNQFNNLSSLHPFIILIYVLENHKEFFQNLSKMSVASFEYLLFLDKVADMLVGRILYEEHVRDFAKILPKNATPIEAFCLGKNWEGLFQYLAS